MRASVDHAISRSAVDRVGSPMAKFAVGKAESPGPLGRTNPTSLSLTFLKAPWIILQSRGQRAMSLSVTQPGAISLHWEEVKEQKYGRTDENQMADRR